MIRAVIAMIAALALVSCTSMQVVKGRESGSIRHEVSVGDDVEIWMTSGTFFELKVSSVGDDSLVGSDDHKKSWKVPYKQISKLEVRKVSVLKTTALTLAAIYAVLWLALPAVGDSMVDALSGDGN